MIHYVTQIKANGDETVLLTFGDELDAYKYALGCYTRDVEDADPEEPVFTYRVDSITPTKEFLSSVYGKVMHRGHITAPRLTDATSANQFTYAGTDSLAVQPQRDDWKLEELFPDRHDGYTTQTCFECGSLVNLPYMERHVSWHNKLLP